LIGYTRPQRIAAPNYPGGASLEPLRAGMMLSNEPGYYKAGEFGIRIENLILTVPREIAGGDPDRRMLGFETLTFVPIERDLIDHEFVARFTNAGQLVNLNEQSDEFGLMVFEKFEKRSRVSDDRILRHPRGRRDIARNCIERAENVVQRINDEDRRVRHGVSGVGIPAESTAT